MNFKKILLSDLIPDKKNPRKNLQPEDPEFKKINTSIERFGFLEPIVFNTKTKKILGGHQRLKVVRNQGAVSLHVIQLGAYSWAFTDDELKELSEQEESAANIALNKAKGDWAVDQLVENLKELKTDGMLDLTGFDEKEFAALLDDIKEPEPPQGVAVKDTFEIIVECQNETEQEQTYNNLIEDGYKCRVLTL